MLDLNEHDDMRHATTTEPNPNADVMRNLRERNRAGRRGFCPFKRTSLIKETVNRGVHDNQFHEKFSFVAFEIMQRATTDYHPQGNNGEPNRIEVAVRIRPLLEKEIPFSRNCTIAPVDNNSVLIRDDFDFDEYGSPVRRYRRSSQTSKMFSFDRVFDENADQRTVFECSARPLIESVLSGINACVFASGATGSGKTYTMLGDGERPGVMALSLYELFHRLGHSPNVTVRCSFVEIYNEVIKDLLTDYGPNPAFGSLEVREVQETGFTYVNGATEVTGITEVHEIMELLHVGNSRRTTEPTAANETSSRSHAILQLVVEQHSQQEGYSLVSKLSLVDLAGSERAKDTQNRGLRFFEGGNINKSLLALGNCIKALASGTSFVPYRDSKLTRLLKDSLGGNCRTVMIANVSPFVYNYTDSLNTLKFANRAKNIKVKVKRNAIYANSESEIQKYVSIIHQLEDVVSGLREQLNRQNGSANEQSSKEYLVYTDESESDEGSLGEEPDREEWLLKNQLMETISEQLKIRNELAHIESSCSPGGSSGVQKADLIDSLKLNADRSDLLHRSMSNLHRRRSGVPSTNNLLNECCQATRRILGDRSAFQPPPSPSPTLPRQSSLVRNKSTRSLQQTPQLEKSLPTESKLARLRDDLLSIEKERSAKAFLMVNSPEPPSFTSRASPPSLSLSWKPQQPVRVPLRSNIEPISLQPHISMSSRSSSTSRKSAAGLITFN